VCIHCLVNVFTDTLTRNSRLFWLRYRWFKASCEISSFLRLLSNLRGCNVGITDGRDLRNTLSRWAQVSWYIYISNFIKTGSGSRRVLGGGGKYTDTQRARWCHKPHFIFSKRGSRQKFSLNVKENNAPALQDQPVLYTETNAIYSGNRMKPKNTLCGYNGKYTYSNGKADAIHTRTVPINLEP
jgi:hypothetical protein